MTLQRLRRNKQLNAADLTALERMLLESGAGEEADIARAAEDAHGLGLFVRSLVGLDREAATEAFSGFLADTTFTVDQIRFVNLIVEHLTDNGVMEARRLYESPFTDHAPHGPDMIFPDDVLDGLILTLDSVRAHALPDPNLVPRAGACQRVRYYSNIRSRRSVPDGWRCGGGRGARRSGRYARQRA